MGFIQYCDICGQPIQIGEATTNRHGRPVHLRCVNNITYKAPWEV